jgi:chromosomal replication initiator protein
MNDPPDPNLTFDNYVVTKGNSFAVELAGTVASKSPSQLPYNPLYLYGDVGLGKTHLLSAIANAAEDKEVLLLNTADLETELERAERLKSRAELREWLTSVEILLVDDIQLCEGREDFSVISFQC